VVALDQKLADLSERAEASSFPWARALVCRCRGLLADESALDEHFLQASEWHALANQPFALARTRLCYGERLRHARRRREARDQLRPALEIFEQLDARPWAERAAAELRATGERAQESSPPVLRPLTSQEARVAIAVAQGATNLEAARTLFISPKTVEFHLANVYRKLSLRSRTELARLIADDEPVRTGM
jgi:DNA-binding CsgD family transcriptional regulator